MILARDVWFIGGGLAGKRYGRPTRVVRIPRLGGEELLESLSRASVATFQGRDGRLYTAAAGVLRVGNYLDLDNDGIYETGPCWLLESTVTNLLENGSYESDANGTTGQVAAVARDATHTILGSWACKVTTTNATFSGANIKNRSGARFAAVAGTTYTGSAWVYVDAANVGKHIQLALDWWDVSPAQIGSSSSASVALRAGWQRISVTGTAPVNTVTAIFNVRDNLAEGVWDFWIDGAQVEAGAYATSVIETNTGTATRLADQLSFAWYLAPKACSVYVALVESGMIITGTFVRVVQLGSGSGGSQRWLNIRANGGGTSNYGLSHETNGGAPASISNMANGSGPAIGTFTELKGDVFGDGSVQLSQATSLGAVTQAARGGACAFLSAWASPTLNVGPSSGALNLFALAIVGANGPVPTMDDFRALL